MSTDINDILSSFDSIINENKTFIDEVSASSTSLFGGSSVRIPADGAHKGQSGWQSNNAWDIPTPINSPVYAVADGVVLTFSDYGPNPIHKDGKTLFGAGFTVNSANGLPDVYYTHLKNCTVGKGSQIKCGQLLGYVMDFPGSDYDHLHIGVEPGHNIKEFLNPDGTLKCGGTISGEASEPVQSTDASDTSTGTTSNTTTTDSDDDFDVAKVKDSDDIMIKKAREMAGQFGIKEEIFKSFETILKTKKSLLSEVSLAAPLDSVKVNSGFGPRWGTTHNGVDLAANAANVKAPADGVVEIGEIKNDACGGTIVINHANGFKTGFCHMQKINVHAGQQVKQGDIIGISGGGANDPGHGRSDGRHLHFTLRQNGKLLNPIDYINKDGIIMTGEPPKSPTTDSTSKDTNSDIEPDTKTDSTSSKTNKKTNDVDDEFGVNKINYNDIMFKKAKELASKFGLNEQKVYGNFGDRLYDRFGSIIIPARTNSKIKSPVDGIIYSTHSNLNCKNQVVIEHEIDDRRHYLQFCNITEPNVKNGKKISKGETLGKTTEDVKVSLFDSGWDKKDLVRMMDKEIKSPVKSLVKPTIQPENKPKKNKKKEDNDDDNKDKKEPRKYYDPIIPFLFKKVNDVIPSISKNKEGEKPKISNFFNKYSLSNKKPII
jgi:murein DD-endopeptidase MepM/ murein hydrolase activator NlpD